MYPIANPSDTLSPSQHAQLRRITVPVGTASEVMDELKHLDSRKADIEREYRHALKAYRRTLASVPEAVGGDARAEIERAANANLQEAELTARQELLLLERRAQSMREQVAILASMQSMTGLDPRALNRANVLQPSITAELTNAPIDRIRNRVRAAITRDDDAELAAVALALPSLLNSRDDDSETFELRDIASEIGQATARFRDTSLDTLVACAELTVEEVQVFDEEVFRHWRERNDVPNPYFSLERD